MQLERVRWLYWLRHGNKYKRSLEHASDFHGGPVYHHFHDWKYFRCDYNVTMQHLLCQ